MSSAKLTLFGSPTLEKDGNPVIFKRQKALALLAYLSVTQQPCQRDILATLFWPDSDQQSARANLRGVLPDIKKQLGANFLQIHHETLRLHPDTGIWVDVTHFRALLSCSFPHPQTEACPRCAPRLTEAARLYRGDLLSGFTLRGSLPFDDWQRTQTENLRREMAGVLQRLIPWYIHLGNAETALEHAHRWLALDPLHEAAHRAVIQLLLQTGQCAAAQEQYETCVRLLREELGLAPSPETTALVKTFGAGVRQENKPVSAFTLTTTLIGREVESLRLTARLADPACRLLTLVGMGGVGKTRLAGEVVRETGRQGFLDGMVFIPLENAHSQAEVLLFLAEALGLEINERLDAQSQILAHLQNKHLLLILDNFEHLLSVERKVTSLPPAAEMLLQLIHTAPHVKLLVTSRERLNLREEWVIELGGLAPLSAAQLFVERARQAGVELPPAELPAITHICQHLDGLPLAIEMAAAWLPLLSLTQIAAELETDLDGLTTRVQDTPDRQHSLRAIFESSWKWLSDPERESLMCLSVFRGGIHRAAAEQAANTPFPLLMALRSKSLIQNTIPDRYSLHPLIRQFAAEKLAASSGSPPGSHPSWMPAGHPMPLAERPDLSQRAFACHSQYFMTFLATREQALKGIGQVEALNEIDAEIGNIQAAWEWALGQGQIELFTPAVESLYRFYHIRSRLHDGAKSFNMAVEVVRQLGDANRPRLAPLLARLLARQGKFHLRLGNNPKAENLFQESLTLARESNLAGEAAFALNELGTLSLSRKEYPTAMAFYQESLLLHSQTGEKGEANRVLNNLGIIAKLTGDLNAAQNFYRQSLEICREIGDQRSAAIRLTNLGNLALVQKDYLTARQHYQESHEIFQTLGDISGSAICLINLGNLAVEMEKSQEARQYFLDARALATESGNRSVEDAALEGLTRTERV